MPSESIPAKGVKQKIHVTIVLQTDLAVYKSFELGLEMVFFNIQIHVKLSVIFA